MMTAKIHAPWIFFPTHLVKEDHSLHETCVRYILKLFNLISVMQAAAKEIRNVSV